MLPTAEMQCVAFDGFDLIARGGPGDVIEGLKSVQDDGRVATVFEMETGHIVEFDLRGGVQDILARLPVEAHAKKGPGRPKLGVASREVTLLPRHWQWLATQPGGASVSLRKLVESAMRSAEAPDRVRKAKEATYRFMTTLAGNLDQYEEAVRHLFNANAAAFERATAHWPADVRQISNEMARAAWS